MVILTHVQIAISSIETVGQQLLDLSSILCPGSENAEAANRQVSWASAINRTFQSVATGFLDGRLPLYNCSSFLPSMLSLS